MPPTDRDLMLVERILEDAATLERRVEHFGLTETAFCTDHSFEGELAYDAVMNPLYRIAEDVVHLSDDLKADHPSYPWKEIRGFRNFIAHGYSEIDRHIAWRIIENDIPQLKDFLEQL